MLKPVLQGKPIGHPLHPMLVHFPIAFFVLSLLLDLGTLLFPNLGRLSDASFYSMLFAVVTALLAAVPGFIDYGEIRQDHPARRVATQHMVLNLVTIGIYAVNLGLRYTHGIAQNPGWIHILISLAGILVLSWSGYLGASLVYEEGISVGRHRRDVDSPQNTLRPDLGSSEMVPSGTGKSVRFVRIAPVEDLPERGTLRAELGGYVIAVARLDGELFAFQDFCTHRYAPLSEGILHDGQVECPWHQSCFDVRSGKVTQGPAKVDLKTFPVRAKDGQIWVGLPAD